MGSATHVSNENLVFRNVLLTVVWNLVTSSVDTDEAEVVDRLELAHLGAVHGVRRQRLGVELGGAVVGEGVGDVQVTEPIADEVGVASPCQDSDTRLDHCREGGNERSGIYSIMSMNVDDKGYTDVTYSHQW